MARWVMMLYQISTWLSQEEYVGVKCMVDGGCFASQAWTFGVLVGAVVAPHHVHIQLRGDVGIDVPQELIDKNVILELWSRGQRLRDGFNVLAHGYSVYALIGCIGLGPRVSTVFRDAEGQTALELKSLFQQVCLKRGVLFSGGRNMCFRYSPADVKRTLHGYRTALEICTGALRDGVVRGLLGGSPVQPVFR